MNACKDAPLDVVKWLFETIQIGNENVLCASCLNNDINVFEYLVETYHGTTESIIGDVFPFACYMSRYEVVTWIHKHYKLSQEDAEIGLNYAYCGKHLKVVKWLIGTFNMKNNVYDILNDDVENDIWK